MNFLRSFSMHFVNAVVNLQFKFGCIELKAAHEILHFSFRFQQELMEAIHRHFVCFQTCLELFTLCLEFFVKLFCEPVGCIHVIDGDFHILAGLAQGTMVAVGF